VPLCLRGKSSSSFRRVVNSILYLATECNSQISRRSSWQKKTRFSTFELTLLALFSALIVAAKVGLRFPIQVLGHSGVFWMALMVTALGIVPKLDAGTLVGLTSALLAAFLGLGDVGVVHTFASYLMLGVAADLVAYFLGSVQKPVPAALVGGVGNAAKMLVKTLIATLIGDPGRIRGPGDGVLVHHESDFRCRGRLSRPPRLQGTAQSGLLRLPAGEALA